jgi:hypothetical protein
LFFYYFLEKEFTINNIAFLIKKYFKEIAGSPLYKKLSGKLTRENYILKKELEYLLQKKREDSSMITGPYLNQSKREVG